MSNIRIAFYKGWSSKPIDAIKQAGIKIWTLGKYCHVELIQTDSSDVHDHNKWLWYGATAYNPGGTVQRNIQYKPSHWDIFDLPINDTAEKNMVIMFLINNLGMEYDWVGIYLSQFIKVEQHDRDKYFCSEYIAEALQQCNILKNDIKKPHCYSPNSLFSKLRKIKII